MPEIEFITKLHTGTKRDYLGRVMEADKAKLFAAPTAGVHD